MAIFDRVSIRVIAAGVGICGIAIALTPGIAAAGGCDYQTSAGEAPAAGAPGAVACAPVTEMAGVPMALPGPPLAPPIVPPPLVPPIVPPPLVPPLVPPPLVPPFVPPLVPPIVAGAPAAGGLPLTTMGGAAAGKGDPVGPPPSGAPLPGQPIAPGPMAGTH